MTEVLFGLHLSITHLREMVAAKVFQLSTFEPRSRRPHGSVQVSSLAGKPLQMKPLGRTSSQKLLEDLRSMDRGTMPNHSSLPSILHNSRRKNATTSWAR